MSMGLVRVLPEKSVVGAQGEMPPDTTLSRATVYRKTPRFKAAVTGAVCPKVADKVRGAIRDEAA
jgi:hypothetical protein